LARQQKLIEEGKKREDIGNNYSVIGNSELLDEEETSEILARNKRRHGEAEAFLESREIVVEAFQNIQEEILEDIKN